MPKKILNGVRYDTEKAELIGDEEYGHGGDFNRWYAGLYVSPRSKRYFLSGEGGPMSQFATRNSDGSRTSGDEIIPMTKEDAMAWAERHLSVDLVEKYFGDSIEDA